MSDEIEMMGDDGGGYFSDILRAAGTLAQAGITAGKEYQAQERGETAKKASAAEASAQADANEIEAMAQAAVADLFARRAKGAARADLEQRAVAAHAAAEASIAEADRLAAALPSSVVAERSRRSQVRVAQLAAALKAAAVADKGRGGDEYQIAKARLDAAQMVANKGANLSIRRDVAPVPAAGGSALDLITRKVGPLPVWAWGAAGVGVFLLLRRRS